jgi:HPt (histidine-containing phosphotransfer) domain-containing protein
MIKQLIRDPLSSNTAPAPGMPPLLDTADGLERILGNRRLYAQLLQRFQHDHAGSAGELVRLLQSSQYDAALCLAHRLAGTAGLIGARAVQQIASALEEALRQLVPSSPGVTLQQLAACLLQTGNAIAAALAELPRDGTTTPEAHAGPDDPAAMAVAKQLASLLEEGDGAAIDLLDSSASTLLGLLGVDGYQEVAAAAHEFDFEAALEALQRQR